VHQFSLNAILSFIHYLQPVQRNCTV